MRENQALRDRFEYLKFRNANGQLTRFELVEELFELAKFFKEKPYR